MLNKTLLAAGLAAFLVSVPAHFPRTGVGAPYESWDESWSWVGSLALDGAPASAYIHYGSLDTAVFVAANTWYKNVDDVGRKTPIFFYLNHYPGSWSNPSYYKEDLGMFQWVRGIKDRRPIFLARGIYYLLASTLILAAAAVCILVFRWQSWPFVWAMVFLVNSYSWSFLAAQALPNGAIAALAVLCGVAAAIYVRTHSAGFFIGSVCCVALATNFKIDGLMLAAIPGCALIFTIRNRPVKQSILAAVSSAFVFILVIVVTRWRIVIDPLEAARTVVRSLRAHTAWLGPESLSMQERIEWLFSYVDQIVMEELFLPQAWGAWFLCLGLLALLGSLIVFRRRLTQPAFVQFMVFMAPALLFALFYSFFIPYPFHRYLLRSFTLVCAGGGYIAAVGISSHCQKTLRLGRVVGVLIVGLAVMGMVKGWNATREACQSIDAGTGLDQSHSRNRAVLRALDLLKTGAYGKSILVDQHSNLDQRVLLENAIDPVYINAANWPSVLGKFKALDGPKLLIWSPGSHQEAEFPNLWGDQERRQYEDYMQALGSIPELWRTGRKTMNVLAHAPCDTEDIVVISVVE